MRVPAVCGMMDRRILANFHIDPEVMARVLPKPFRPKLANGYAIGGICLIRLKGIRPKRLPLPWGIRSENAAHRIAVEWEVDGQLKEGVYIPRRDTNSRFNTLTGGTIFPGIHYHAAFTVKEIGDYYSVALQSDDGETHVAVAGTVTDHLPDASVFCSLTEASGFFQGGALGYSKTRTAGRYDGLELYCDRWKVEPLEVEYIESSYFEDKSQFPQGSVDFDCGLLMRNIPHQWLGHEDLCCAASTET